MSTPVALSSSTDCGVSQDMSNPFPDTVEDIFRRGMRQELDRLREMARAIEDEANELANEITKFEDGLEERWEKQDETN